LTNQEIAAKAADLIEQRGHAKGALYDHRGRLCLLGALNMAVSGLPRHNHGGTRAMRYVEQFIGDQDAVRWNNAPERTPEEVIAVLRRAAGVRNPHERELVA
jgi:hypothetical protein